MSQTVITEAFEQWKAQQAANGQAVVLDEFVFANVPNLDVNAPIDRTAGMPAAAQIVYRQAVEKTGLVNENAVVYSVTLGADVGDFSFNWIGLTNKATGKLAMVVHAPLQSKVKNANGQQGNVLTRSFLMEYNGAEAQTLISTPAETWQIDFTARLSGMDEALRLANLDIYGAGAFFDTGFLVNKTGTQYFVTAGAGYVGGLRAALAANANITVTTKPVKVWADVSYHGTLTSAYQTDIKFTLATTLANYAQSGINHYVFALASIDANGVITDLRPKGSSLYLRRDKNLSDVADPVAALDTLNGVPKTRKINDKPLSADIALSPADVGALPAGGTAVAATKLATARKIAGVAFDGTADISLLPANVGALPAGGTAVAATKLATARKIAGVAFDGTADISLLPANVGALPAGGTAVAATKLATARKIAGVSFDGTGDINLYGLGNTTFGSPEGISLSTTLDAKNTGFYGAYGDGNGAATEGLPAGLGNTAFAMTVTQYVSNTAFVMLQGQGDLYFGSLNTADASKNVWRRVYSDVNKPTAADVGALPAGGTAVAASKLATARKIAGVAFDGTKDIELTADNVGAVSTSGGTINADYVPLTLKNVNDKQALVLRGEKKDGTLRWYVGSGSGSNDNVQLNNYVTGTSFDLGDTAKINTPLAITGTVTPSNYTNFDERYSLKNTASKAATGWFKDATTGMIFQWGGGAIAGSGSKLTFPIAFPTACVRVIATDIGTDHRSFGAAPSSTTQAVFYPETNGTSCSYFAIGY